MQADVHPSEEKKWGPFSTEGRFTLPSTTELSRRGGIARFKQCRISIHFEPSYFKCKVNQGNSSLLTGGHI